MKNLKTYIFGMATIAIILPIIDELTEVICGYLEVLKGESTKAVMKTNKEIADLQAELEPIDTNCIGFEIPNAENDIYEECENKSTIGFKC